MHAKGTIADLHQGVLLIVASSFLETAPRSPIPGYPNCGPAEAELAEISSTDCSSILWSRFSCFVLHPNGFLPRLSVVGPSPIWRPGQSRETFLSSLFKLHWTRILFLMQTALRSFLCVPSPRLLLARPPTLAHSCWLGVGLHRQLQLLLLHLFSSWIPQRSLRALIFFACVPPLDRCSPGCARGSLKFSSLHSTLCGRLAEKCVITTGAPPCVHELLCPLPERRILEVLPPPLAPHFVLEVEVLPCPCLLSPSSADVSQEQQAAMEYHKVAAPKHLSTPADASSSLSSLPFHAQKRCGHGLQHTLLESFLTRVCCFRLLQLCGTTPCL